MAVSRTHSGRERGRKEGLAARGGFTLIELLTALTVMGIATTIFVNLYTSSVTLAQTNRGQRVAASLAEEYMAYILNYPGEVDWAPAYDPESATELTRVALPTSVGSPAAFPTIQRSYNRTKNLYAKYTQEAWARVPEREAEAKDGSEYLEVVVVVSWQQGGRDRFFSLTSTIPRGKVREAQST